jgi:hypothetical protein
MTVPGPDTRTNRQASSSEASSGQQSASLPGVLAALLCERCDWLIADGCPCRLNTTSRDDVEARHREAVARAQASAERVCPPLPLAPARQPRVVVDPTGRGWAA